jgi:hypothetical protein
MDKKRSKGVIILGILVSLFGLSGFQDILREGRNIYVLISVLFSIVLLISGIGVLMLKSWARKLLLYSIIPALAFNISVNFFIIEVPKQFQHLEEHFLELHAQIPLYEKIVPSLGFLIWGVVIIFFLTRPKVKEQFR